VGAALPPDLGGQGRGCVELALLNEVLGRCHYAPEVFGAQAPDSGNARSSRCTERRPEGALLQPLVDGDIARASR